MSVNQTQHRHIDANLQVTLACPAAGAAGTTASLDTRSGANALAVAGPGQTASWDGQRRARTHGVGSPAPRDDHAR